METGNQAQLWPVTPPTTWQLVFELPVIFLKKFSENCVSGVAKLIKIYRN